jgi:hypothetical protein
MEVNSATAAKFSNCTIAGNVAPNTSIYFSGYGLEIRNSVLWNLATPEVSNAAFFGAHGDYSIIKGVWLGYGANNLSLDPLFMNEGGGDFRLRSDSPGINSGDEFLDAGPHDLEGHTRVLCGQVDIGAYELGAGDSDCNGSVELGDVSAFQDCMAGPGGARNSVSCAAFEFNGDRIVDMRDFAGFSNAFGQD